MYNGLNNKLANVPTITGLSNVVADQVVTDTLIVDGNDIGVILDQVPINTANIAALQQVTTGQTYASVGDTTTFDNNVTLGAGKTMTADNFTGLASNASQVLVTLNNDATTYHPIFVTAGTGQKGLLLDSTTTPFSYVPSTSTLSATNFTAGTNVTAPNLLGVSVLTPSNARNFSLNGTPIGNGGNTSCVFMGNSAGTQAPNTAPNNNFCFGTNSGSQLTTGGVQNLFIGANSGNIVTSGRNNCFLGASAGRKTVSGQYNTQIGAQSQVFPDENAIGSYNTTIGADAYILNDGLSFSTAIGANAVATTSNTIQMGRAADNTNFSGTVTLNNNLILTSPATTLTPTELSYLDGVTSNIQAQFGGKVNNTGDETIAGIKTFSSVPICATNATTSTQLTNKAYVDAAVSGATPANMVTTNTTQTITGTKTFDGVTTTFQTNAFTPNSTVTIRDTGTSNSINFIPNAGIGAYNFLTEAGDSLIMIGGTNVGDLTIAPDSSTLSGIRLTPTTTFIGVGGASTTRTAGISCSGTNVGVTGTLTLNNDLILTTPATTLTQTELSRLDGVSSNIQTQFSGKVNNTGNENIDGIKTFSSVPICTTNATTSTQLTNKAYVDAAVSGFSGFVTTNTVQNITANKTMLNADLLIDDGTGNNTSLSQDNQIMKITNNNTNGMITITGVIAATSLNRVIPTDGSNPTTAQILNRTITGTNIPNQTSPYFVSAHTFNALEQITTLSLPSGQIQSVGSLIIGMFITSGLGTNFSNGTYVTGFVSGTTYTINQPALNTTLFKVGVNFSLITASLTLSAPVANGTIRFGEFAEFQFLTNNSGTTTMPLNINSARMNVNVPTTITGTTNLGVTNITGDCIFPAGSTTWFNNNLLISANALGSAATLRVISFAGTLYLQAGATSSSGTADIVFSSIFSGTPWATMNTLGLTMGATCMYGRDDQFAFLTVPAGAANQPIGFTTTFIEAAVTFTNNTAFNYTTLPLLDNGVWDVTAFLTLLRGTGTFNNNSQMSLGVINSGTTNYYPDSCTSDMPLPSGHTALTYSVCMNYKFIVKSTVQERTGIQGFINMAAVGTATKRLRVVLTKIA